MRWPRCTVPLVAPRSCRRHRDLAPRGRGDRVFWLARRRGGDVLLLGVGAVLAVVMRFYGPSLLTEPWNPYLPLLWWLVFLLAVWSVLDDDIRMLPIVVIAGSLCAQTHVSYVGPTFGLGALAVAVVLSRVIIRRRPGVMQRAGEPLASPERHHRSGPVATADH